MADLMSCYCICVPRCTWF